MATLAAISLLVAGCSKNSDIDPVPDGDATLSLNLSLPAFGVQLKSVSDNPSEPETWSAWERAVDGRYLYRVTAFLLSGNRLVAKEDLSLSGEPEEAQLTFNGNFTHGKYVADGVIGFTAFQDFTERCINGIGFYQIGGDIISGTSSAVIKNVKQRFPVIWETF